MKTVKLLSCLFISATLSFSQKSFADDQYSLGIEGFRDHYRETPEHADVTIDTNYGSLTGTWMHGWNMLNQDKFMFGLDGRASYGTDQYKSPSGTESGIPEYELDGRILTGFKFGEPDGSSYFPYLGLGLRYYWYEGKGHTSSIGDWFYDRRIAQSYVPLGITYDYTTQGGISITPNFEFDALIRGFVDSRLQNGGLYDVNNTQRNGYGLRSEIMAGWKDGSINYQFGPFVRFWSFQDSDFVHTPNLPPGAGYYEPANNRIQYGLAFKVQW